MERIYRRLLGCSRWLRRQMTPILRRLLRFVAMPWWFATVMNWRDCPRSRLAVAGDFLYVFFVLKTFPDNYAGCRLWEKQRSEWAQYYGSSYDPWQRYKLRKDVQRFEYEMVFEDKEVCLMLCEARDLPTPELLGIVDPLTDWRGDLERLVEMRGGQEVIVKPVTGSGGHGIFLARPGTNGVCIVRDGAESALADHTLSERALVQAVVKQLPEVAAFHPRSLNTVRILTLATVDGEVLTLGAAMRFGVGENYRDNGGVAAGVDQESGTLFDQAVGFDGSLYDRHPDSRQVFAGWQVPLWEQVQRLAHEVQAAFPFFRLLGTDVALTEDGPLVIEINAIPDVVFQERTSGPLLADPRILREFGRWDLLVNKQQKKLLAKAIASGHGHPGQSADL